MSLITPKVSVIIPTYKRDIEYLSRAIDSILTQTYSNVEIVIVDDNTQESNFRKEVSKFMDYYINDQRFVYLRNAENIGGSLSRNNGINAATGEYITFLDDDDEYLPKKIERQLTFMIRNESDMSFTDLKLVNKNKKIIDYRSFSDLKNFEKETLLKYHIMRHLTGTPTFMYKSHKIKEIGGFEDAKMGQEFYLMLKTIEKNLKISYLNKCDVLAYRHQNGGISQGVNKIKGEKALYDYKKKYLTIFTNREKMFIHFRHYAVMVVAYKRNKNYLKSLYSGVRMVFYSPVDVIRELKKYIIALSKNCRMENDI